MSSAEANLHGRVLPLAVEVPTRADLLAWLGITDPGTSPDAYDSALDAALEAQAARCDVDTLYTEGLSRAALRRAARELASAGLSLGVFDSGDMGTVYLPRWHQEIETEEAPYRLGGFA